jgi:hypothetical protein
MQSLWCVEELCQGAPPSVKKQGEGRLAAVKGNLQLGGSLTITPTVSVPDGGESTSGAILTINPTFGYFVSDGLEIGLSFQAGVGIGELFEKNASTLQIGPTLRYIFNTTGPVVPYLGVLLGPSLIIPENGDTIALFDISFRFGFLVPLNQHVAINFGIRPTFSVGVGNANGMIFTIPIGWLGVETFF